jgi:hypothetical protein
MKHRNAIHMTILFALGSLALLPTTQAVSPAPDGGYPGGNTAEGQNALLSLTAGTFNTAVGLFSLLSNTEGQFNTAIGAGALLANVGGPSTFEGVENTATGAGALLSNTIGAQNTANGAFALFSNTESNVNTANGDRALFSNTTGVSNTANGAFALQNNTTGADNTATGAFALFSNTEGSRNTANGSATLDANTTGNFNTAIGAFALSNNTTGNDNTAAGLQALIHNTTGDGNTATGRDALGSNTEGNSNTANGISALLGNTTGTNNTANGADALRRNTSGGFNTASGNSALGFNTTGGQNTALGFNAGIGVITSSNVICIGANVAGADVPDSCFVGNIYQKQVGNDSLPVRVDSSGKLGTEISSRRFKRDIKPMDNASEAILALKPVTFHYKSDNTNTPQFGLIAEEVAKVNPDLVVRDKDGEIYTARYEALNAMLLNEFLKEHKKVEELEATVAQQQKGIAALGARLNEQATQIQKVTAKIAVGRSVPHTVLNDYGSESD